MDRIPIRLFFGLLIVAAFLSGLALGNAKVKKSSPPAASTNRIRPTLSPTPTPSFDASPSYAELELSLMREKYNVSVPRSLTFAFQVGNFHPDWECYPAGYSKEGFTIMCQQKPCSTSRTVQWPGKMSEQQNEKCVNELMGREYSQSIKTVTIRASEYATDSEKTDDTKIIDGNKLKRTTAGTYYEYNKTSTSKYNNEYTAVYYSPFELTDRLSKMAGTFYGTDWIYGKYTIRTEVQGNDIDEDKVIKLLERIIDATVFIRPDNG